MPKDKNWHGVLDDLYAASKPPTQETDTSNLHNTATQETRTTHKHNKHTQESNTTNIHNIDAVPVRALSVYDERRNQRVQLLFKPTTHAKLTALAHTAGISLNNLVNSILEDYLEQHKI